MDDQNKIYEIGFHLIPTIAEEALPEEVSKIKSVIEEGKGSVIADDFPKLRQLAYAIDKVIGTTKHVFDKAYFGWIKFEATPECAQAVQTVVEQNDNTLRSLLVKTTREQSILVDVPTFSDNKEEDVVENKKEEVKKPIDESDEKQIDETIEDLVIE